LIAIEGHLGTDRGEKLERRLEQLRSTVAAIRLEPAATIDDSREVLPSHNGILEDGTNASAS